MKKTRLLIGGLILAIIAIIASAGIASADAARTVNIVDSSGWVDRAAFGGKLTFKHDPDSDDAFNRLGRRVVLSGTLRDGCNNTSWGAHLTIRAVSVGGTEDEAIFLTSPCGSQTSDRLANVAGVLNPPGTGKIEYVVVTICEYIDQPDGRRLKRNTRSQTVVNPY